MGRRRGGSALTAEMGRRRGGSDDELLRGDLDEEELPDELDHFQLAREQTLPAGPAARRRPAAQLLPFEDDSASDGERGQTPPLGTGDDQDTPDDSEAAAGGWGRRKASYYSADYIDEDWRGAAREETLQAARLEEREARAVQRRLAERLAHDQLEFGAAAVRPTSEAAAVSGSESVPLDTSRLSERERLAVLRQQCPELPPLLEEFRRRWTELSSELEPVCRLAERGRLAAGPGLRYVSARRRLLLLYCLNISHYLTVRAGRRPRADCHPALRRIAQYGRLLETLAPADRAVAGRLRRLAALDPGPDPGPARPLPTITRRPGPGATHSEVGRQLAALTMEIGCLQRQRRQLTAEQEAAGPTFTERRQVGQAAHSALAPFRRSSRPAQSPPTAEAPPEPDQKRGITHQMARNKGLMPKRSRESRNPRVKHKEKFRRALKRRRSLVRQPKKELTKYGGETFGIRMGAVKSVPIR